MTQCWTLLRRSVAVLALALVAIACTNRAETLLGESHASVLVPTDQDFRASFGFTLSVGPDVYNIFSNTDSEFNESIDRELQVVGWQIDDLDAWQRAVPGETETDRELLAQVVADATAHSSSACDVLDPTTGALSCRYGDRSFVARSFGDTHLIVVDSPAAGRFITHDFDLVPVDQATDWFTPRNP